VTRRPLRPTPSAASTPVLSPVEGEAADQIARRLNSDPIYSELNDKTINLHTNLKGKVKWVGGKAKGYPVFQQKESEISDDDLKELRKLSRELDHNTSPYSCIVSVLMLSM